MLDLPVYAEALQRRFLLSFDHLGVALPSYYAQDFYWPENPCDYGLADHAT